MIAQQFHSLSDIPRQGRLEWLLSIDKHRGGFRMNSAVSRNDI